MKTLTTIPVCATPEQTGCVCSWRTFKTGYLSPGVTKENARGDSVLVTNPISWTTENKFVERTNNKGLFLLNSIKFFRHPLMHKLVMVFCLPKSQLFPGAFCIKPVIITLETLTYTTSMFVIMSLPGFARFNKVNSMHGQLEC